MEDTLVSPKLAELAKKKGCHIFSNRFYCEQYGLCELGEESLLVHIGTKDFRVIYDVNSEFGITEFFYAIRLDQLQTWLRNVHGIYTIPMPSYTCNELFKNKFHFENHYLRKINTSAGYYKTYEEALEAGLLAALELIP